MKNYPTSKIIMYVQRLDHLPFASLDALDTRINQLDYLKRYAWIVHDKDMAEDGSKVSPHVHVTFEFNKPIPLNKLAKALNNEKPNYFQRMTRRGQSAQSSAANAFRYLVHRTKNSRAKYQYNPKEVHANFWYAEYLKSTRPKKPKRIEDNQRIETLLSEFSEGRLSKEQLICQIFKVDPLQASSRMKQIDNLDAVRNIVKGHKWKTQHHEKVVLWFYGGAGTGKTSEAKHILGKKFDEGYFVSGGDRDLFENYSSQHGILLDDLRSTSMPYDEVLRMLDPYNLEVEVGSRYHNKQVQGEIYIITCPLNPYKFYKGMQEVQGLDFEDSYDQLGRRINMVVHFSREKIKIEDPDQEEQMVIDEIDNPIEESMEALYEVADKVIETNFTKDPEKSDEGVSLDWEDMIDHIDSLDDTEVNQLCTDIKVKTKGIIKPVIRCGLLEIDRDLRRMDEYLMLPRRVRGSWDYWMYNEAKEQLEALNPKDPKTRPDYDKLEGAIDQLKEDHKDDDFMPD